MNVGRTVAPGFWAIMNDRTSFSAAADPRPADPAHDGAAQLSARLLEAHGADSDNMQGHAADAT